VVGVALPVEGVVSESRDDSDAGNLMGVTAGHAALLPLQPFKMGLDTINFKQLPLYLLLLLLLVWGRLLN